VRECVWESVCEIVCVCMCVIERVCVIESVCVIKRVCVCIYDSVYWINDVTIRYLMRAAQTKEEDQLQRIAQPRVSLRRDKEIEAPFYLMKWPPLWETLLLCMVVIVRDSIMFNFRFIHIVYFLTTFDNDFWHYHFRFSLGFLGIYFLPWYIFV